MSTTIVLTIYLILMLIEVLIFCIILITNSQRRQRFFKAIEFKTRFQIIISFIIFLVLSPFVRLVNIFSHLFYMIHLLGNTVNK